MEQKSFFSDSSISIHLLPEQLKQQEGLSTINISNVDPKTKTAEFIENLSTSTIPILGNVSLSDCTCSHFQTKQLPCSHMYKLAEKLKLFKVIRPKRRTKLIADFSSGYAENWKFAVPTCFRESLDTKLTPRVIRQDGKKLSIDEWTQYHLYNFNYGAVLYNDKIAYEVCWKEALKKLKYSIQIESAMPSITYNDITFEKGMILNRQKIRYGNIVFKLYSPNSDQSNITLIKTFHCTQDHFVHLLQTGIIVDIHGHKENLFSS